MDVILQRNIFPGVFKAFLVLQLQCFDICAFFFSLSFSSSSSSSKQQEQDPTNLYISNLPVSVDEQELENMLKHFGQVISTRILRDSSGVSRGVGFARWDSFVIYCQI